MFRNAIITGACGGLGQALAHELITSGARVALVGLNLTALKTLAALAPERTRIYNPDVSDAAAMQAMASDWVADQATPDLVIANAGVAGGFETPSWTDTLQRWFLGEPYEKKPPILSGWRLLYLLREAFT